MNAPCYVVVPVHDEAALTRVRLAVARPWLMAFHREARYWVATLEDAEAERAVLALAGFASRVEDTLITEKWRRSQT